LDPGAKRELASFQKQGQRRILSAIESLVEMPRPAGCTKLSGFRDIWRIRVGVYRIIYRIEDRQLVVQVIRIAHRREAYRGL
jgi:mRNA interferase RelE/StbE